MVVKVLALEMLAQQTPAAAAAAGRKVLLEEPAALVSSFFPIQSTKAPQLHLILPRK
jgi:hypothetical protein